MNVIRQGLTRDEAIWIALVSQRPEEKQHGPAHLTGIEADPNAIVLEIDGRAVAAGGLKKCTPQIGVLWISSVVDLHPYRREIVRHARRIIEDAKAAGMRVVSFVPRGIPRDKVISEHFGLRPSRQVGAQTMYVL